MGGRTGPRPALDAGGVWMMRVKVDGDKCQGHSRCYAVAAELFNLDELGYSHEKGDGAVSKELEEKARLAVANCPERAIEIVSE